MSQEKSHTLHKVTGWGLMVGGGLIVLGAVTSPVFSPAAAALALAGITTAKSTTFVAGCGVVIATSGAVITSDAYEKEQNSREREWSRFFQEDAVNKESEFVRNQNQHLREQNQRLWREQRLLRMQRDQYNHQRQEVEKRCAQYENRMGQAQSRLLDIDIQSDLDEYGVDDEINECVQISLSDQLEKVRSELEFVNTTEPKVSAAKNGMFARRSSFGQEEEQGKRVAPTRNNREGVFSIGARTKLERLRQSRQRMSKRKDPRSNLKKVDSMTIEEFEEVLGIF